MNDRDLDKKLQTARNQSEKFFSNLNFDDYRYMVYNKILTQQRAETKNIVNTRVKMAYIFSAATLCIILITVLVSNQMGHRQKNPGTPVLQQTIGLEDKDSHLINYFRIDNPNKNNNLLAVIWQKNSKGNYNIVYSSIMEDAHIPNPVAIINIPYSKSRYALVSSSNRNQDFIHYRLVKYSADSATAYLEENYVPGGKIEVDNGILIEERVIPADYHLEDTSKAALGLNKTYRYFIPIELRADGSFALTTNRIRLKKGAVLTLISDGLIGPSELEYNSEVLDKKKGRPAQNETIGSSIDFDVRKEGRVNLKIGPKANRYKTNELLIEVIE